LNVSAHDPVARTAVRGKFFESGGTKFYVRGLSYGSTHPDGVGSEFPDKEILERDFARMAAIRANGIRTTSVPPAWLLDAAWRHGLRVMVGLPVERWLGRLLDGGRVSEVEKLVRRGVSDCARHPSVLCYGIGYDVQAPIVDWLGRHRLERLLHGLYLIAKAQDPDGLVTYVNSASSVDLRLGFLDLVTLKVGLDTGAQLERELLRWQGVAGDRPLLVELGLDAGNSGEERPGSRLAAQLRTALANGCAGAFLNGPIGDFGTMVDPMPRLTATAGDSEREAASQEPKKPALTMVRSAFASAPFPARRRWPRVTVAVCTRNSSDSLRDCLDGIRELEYPDYETIVVDDRSTDNTAAIARAHGARLVRSPRHGLAASRNTALETATGEFVAFVGDNVVVDPHWLTYLVAVFGATDHVAVGGPTIARPGHGLVAECVANSPGAPGPALASDGEADVIAASNVAYRRAKLRTIGGFDSAFGAGGGDVDVSWRLREQGWTLGFSPGAVVWRPAASTIGGYWEEQRSDGMTEGLLERKWPRKFSVAGQVLSGARPNGEHVATPARSRYRGYQSLWGVAPVESRGGRKRHAAAIVLTPEWYLLIASLLCLTVLGIGWTPLLVTGPLLIVAVVASVLQAFKAAGGARFEGEPPSLGRRVMRRTLTAFLNLLQPAARLRGRLQSGLTPWRRKRLVRLTVPRRHTLRFWAKPRSHEVWVESVQDALAQGGAAAVGIRPADTFDLEERAGTFGAARMMIALEDHPSDRQFVRLRLWPRWSLWAKSLAGAFILVAAVAFADGAWAVAGVFGLMAAHVGLSAYSQSAAALLDLREAVGRQVRATAMQVPAPAVAVDSSTRAIAVHASAQGTVPDPLEHRRTAETTTAATPPGGPGRTPDAGNFSRRKAAPSSICTACGLVLAPAARFCRACGQRQVRMRPGKVARRKARTTG
jgi:GT2 family glycosyltransferase